MVCAANLAEHALNTASHHELFFRMFLSLQLSCFPVQI